MIAVTLQAVDALATSARCWTTSQHFYSWRTQAPWSTGLVCARKARSRLCRRYFINPIAQSLNWPRMSCS